MNLGTAQVLRADARSLPLADDSVDLVVTSPPYFALRSYQDGGEHYAGQIGSEPTPAEFVDALLEVTRECVRVLKPSGSLWVNLGDKYAGSNGQQGGGGKSTLAGAANGRARDAQQEPLRGRGFVAGGAPAKSLIGIPWRYALACIDDLGLILRAEVIWSKPNGLPESVTDRVRRSHEQWFHFTLSPRYFSAVDEIREEHIYGAPTGRAPNARQGERWFAATGLRPHGSLSTPNVNPLGKLPGSVWTDQEPGDSLIRSVLAATAAGALTPEEGERILWTGSTSSGQRSTRATTWIAGDGSASTTATATDATGAQAKATGEHTASSTRCQSAPSRHGSPSTTCAATDGASTLPTSSPSPCERTSHADHAPSAAQQDTHTTSGTPMSAPTASESAADAWPTESGSGEHEPAPPSVWQIATEPLTVPAHLGVDHFAAFPTEWPKRIIRGWSPSGVCTACGEGRRPVVTRHHERPAGDWKPDKTTEGGSNRPIGLARPSSEVTVDGYACACAPHDFREESILPGLCYDCYPEPVSPGIHDLVPRLPPTGPAVVLDPFGGTGTVAMVAKALGRHGITVDMSADYCRLARWRTGDENQLRKVLGVPKADPVDPAQLDLFGEAVS